MRLFAAFLAAWILAVPAWAAVDIEEVTTDSGITAWLVQEPSIPFVALELRFKGGTSLDAPDKRGAVNLMTGLLEEGAGEYDARGFAKARDALAASFGYDASDDSVSVSAQFLNENRGQAVDLLRQSLMQPRFDEEALERVRGQVLSGLASDARDPSYMARLAFDAMAYGDHPYGGPGRGTLDSVTALTRDDILAAHRGVFARDRLFVAAVGDITPDELRVLLNDLLGDLPATGAPMPEPADVTIPGGNTVIDFETPQSVAIFGQVGIARDHPDFFPMFVLNQLLGGGSFESRLMQEVREKRGLTYGVYSYLAPRDWAAVYMGSVASANDRVAEAISVIRDEWRKAATEGVSAKEVEDAKTYLTGAYPLRFDGNSQIASIMAGMQMEGLPIDYIATRNDQVEAVTLEDVNRVAARYLDPEGLHFVVVGQPEGLDSGTN